ncbi:hypothetical protein ACFZC3_05380 [Streptomyces sp. NPDC007903]|uniref:hypothetical protein n=1 Tax=Streptomyces sp. NPDC007903 TaxID=3364786 RepID=UPI0036E96BBF
MEQFALAAAALMVKAVVEGLIEGAGRELVDLFRNRGSRNGPVLTAALDQLAQDPRSVDQSVLAALIDRETQSDAALATVVRDLVADSQEETARPGTVRETGTAKAQQRGMFSFRTVFGSNRNSTSATAGDTSGDEDEDEGEGRRFRWRRD